MTTIQFKSDTAVDWLVVRVDEDGVMVVRDLVEGIESEPIETVEHEPTQWASDLHVAVVDLLRRAGNCIAAE